MRTIAAMAACIACLVATGCGVSPSDVSTGSVVQQTDTTTTSPVHRALAPARMSTPRDVFATLRLAAHQYCREVHIQRQSRDNQVVVIDNIAPQLRAIYHAQKIAYDRLSQRAHADGSLPRKAPSLNAMKRLVC